MDKGGRGVPQPHTGPEMYVLSLLLFTHEIKAKTNKNIIIIRKKQ